MQDVNKPKSIYVDCYPWADPIKVDDFIIIIGQKKTNSVYHVAESRAKHKPEKRLTRYYLKVYLSDLPTALSREPGQRIIPMTWYKRDRKKK